MTNDDWKPGTRAEAHPTNRTQLQPERTTQMSHQIKIETRPDHILVTCTCGWSSKWKTADGSAQQAAAEHRRNNQ